MSNHCCEIECSLTGRVLNLENRLEQIQNSKVDNHREIYSRLNNLEQMIVVQQERYNIINDKLDALLAWQHQQQEKPEKLQGDLVKFALTAIMSIALGYVAALIGLS